MPWFYWLLAGSLCALTAACLVAEAVTWPRQSTPTGTREENYRAKKEVLGS